MFTRAAQDNLAQIRDLLMSISEQRGRLTMLDLGCGNGENLLDYAPAGTVIHAIEFDPDLAAGARGRGIEVVIADLEKPIPLESKSFDVVISNQVLEHLADTDQFIAECQRMAKPGGVVVVSTENMASWHNIASLLLGWQAFSLTNVSRCAPGIGNPLANLRSEEPAGPGMEHRRIFSYRGLVELLQAHDFESVQIRGAGYYPLPTFIAHHDPRHAAFLTVAGVVPRRLD